MTGTSREQLARQGSRQLGGFKGGSSDYFTLGGTRDTKQMSSYASRTSKGSRESSSSRQKKGPTTPQMSRRMDYMYKMGLEKIKHKKDVSRDEQEYDKAAEDCTFKPKISKATK